jgi:hypothetical protein
MKKFIVVAIILICGCLYGIIRLSMSESQNANGAAETNQSTKSINAGDTDEATPSEETQSAKPINADNTDKAKPEEGSDSAVPAVQVEAITKVFGEFQSAIKSEDYEQAWKLMSEVTKSELNFENFKKGVNTLANAVIHPESAIHIEDCVRLRITTWHEEQEMDLSMFFIQEDGQWKASGLKPAQNVDTSKE